MSSPTRLRAPSIPKPNSNVPHGFRPMAKPHQTPVNQMTLRELHDRHHRNQQLLTSPSGSSSTALPRITAEQAQIEARLVEIEGVDSIRRSLKNARISAEEDMSVDPDPEPYVSPTLLAKQKALANFMRVAPSSSIGNGGGFTLQEAMEIERQAHMQDQERHKRVLERKQKHGLVSKGEVLTREEQEARLWAFMNYKPSESDMEEEDEEDSDDDDPSTWFEDDQDGGRKGQDIVDPDIEELTDIIRMDDSKFHYNTFYEPHDEID